MPGELTLVVKQTITFAVQDYLSSPTCHLGINDLLVSTSVKYKHT